MLISLIFIASMPFSSQQPALQHSEQMLSRSQNTSTLTPCPDMLRAALHQGRVQKSSEHEKGWTPHLWGQEPREISWKSTLLIRPEALPQAGCFYMLPQDQNTRWEIENTWQPWLDIKTQDPQGAMLIVHASSNPTLHLPSRLRILGQQKMTSSGTVAMHPALLRSAALQRIQVDTQELSFIPDRAQGFVWQVNSWRRPDLPLRLVWALNRQWPQSKETHSALRIDLRVDEKMLARNGIAVEVQNMRGRRQLLLAFAGLLALGLVALLVPAFFYLSRKALHEEQHAQQAQKFQQLQEELAEVDNCLQSLKEAEVPD